MRSRLLRPATATEKLGMQVVLTDQYRDLLQQMRGQRAGAVDVAREGAPPDNAWRTAPAGGEEAPTLSRTGGGLETADSHTGTETSLDRSGSGTGTGHLLRTSPSSTTLGPTSADISPDARRGMVRRHSLDTVSDPLSEPQQRRPHKVKEQKMLQERGGRSARSLCPRSRRHIRLLKKCVKKGNRAKRRFLYLPTILVPTEEHKFKNEFKKSRADHTWLGEDQGHHFRRC